ncbi:MAG: hypothetical protein JWP48_5996 [Actinoallomurus sp.]|nr:hypothetical protein [Actinoallomurus sp.]
MTGEQQMIKSIGRHTMAAATVIALGGAGGVASQGPARADVFSAAYTCTVPVLGARPVLIHGRLTASSARAAVNQPIRFHLHINRLSLQSPVAIDSWTAVAGIDATGPQAASFRVAGSGGALTPRQPVSGDLFGTWTPRARGTYRFRGANVTISARVARIGALTATCQPNPPRPVMETVTALSYRVMRGGTDL